MNWGASITGQEGSQLCLFPSQTNYTCFSDTYSKQMSLQTKNMYQDAK